MEAPGRNGDHCPGGGGKDVSPRLRGARVYGCGFKNFQIVYIKKVPSTLTTGIKERS
jgi:hypothetical protein